MQRVSVLVAVAVGGALGTVARYEFALAEPIGNGRFPWATFTANVVGSLLLGVALVAFVDAWASSTVLRPLVGIGFCGGLTTFSTWMIESVLLARDGETGTAALYVIVSLFVGLLAVGLGMFVTRRVVHRRELPVFDAALDD